MENKSIWEKDIREIFRHKPKEITKEFAEQYLAKMDRNWRIRDCLTMGLGGGIFSDNIFKAAEYFIDGKVNHYTIPTILGLGFIIIGAEMLKLHLPDKELKYISDNNLEDRLYIPNHPV